MVERSKMMFYLHQDRFGAYVTFESDCAVYREKHYLKD